MIKAVLWDFDGVIVDSYDTNIKNFQQTFRHFQQSVPSKEELMKFSAQTAVSTFGQFLEKNDKAHVAQAMTYLDAISPKVSLPLISGAEVIIKNLSKSYLQGIISSRGKESLIFHLKNMQLYDYFKILIAYEDVSQHKPHPEPIEKALADLHLSELEAVYIGDMNEDIHAGINAGVKIIAYRNTFNHQVDFSLADYIVEDLEEIPKIITNLNKN